MKTLSRASGLAATMLVAAAACDAGTGGSLVQVSLAARSAPEGSSPLGVFTTDTGWDVVLTEAKLAVGALYAFAPDPDSVATLRTLLLPSVARAHGGVDPLSGRTVRAEWIDGFVVDALSTDTVDLGAVTAQAGAVDAVELRLVPPSGNAALATQGHQAYFAGTATRGATTVDFAGGIDVPDVGTERRVEGVAASYTLDEGGVVTLTMHPATFFRGVQFDTLPAPDPVSGTSALDANGQPYAAIELGVRNPSAYATTYVAGGTP